MTDQQINDSFASAGYAVARKLFTTEEVRQLREHFMKLRALGTFPEDMVADTQQPGDPLQKYPRLIHMHRWDTVTRDWLLDERLLDLLGAFFGCEPLACQSMLYFKPPGARGQALHQDNFYLRVRPGTCIAAWMALDPADQANGCMQLVPGSHDWPTLCPQGADPTKSFTDVTVELPPGVQAAPILMDEGDVLFFTGSVIHGSLPNTTTDRFRRSLIGHYVCERTEYLTPYDQPVLHRDGIELNLKPSEEGGPCGIWVDTNGNPAIEMTGQLATGPAPRE
jgi:ectoine hydroxylase-related dioxygenase (phytanoyl-CoA dioxygenase family)